MPVRTEVRDAQRVVVVDGDLAAAATFVALRATLASLPFTADRPVVVDVSAATGAASPAMLRLLERIGRLMSRRGIPFHVDASALRRAERNQPPATAGMMETVTPSGVGV